MTEPSDIYENDNEAPRGGAAAWVVGVLALVLLVGLGAAAYFLAF